MTSVRLESTQDRGAATRRRDGVDHASPGEREVVLTTSPDRVAGAARGSDPQLTRAEWYELLRAAGRRVP